MAGTWSEQFSSGDQGEMRIQFWRDNYKKCPSCQRTSFSETKSCTGCRHNGDGYGTYEYSCISCAWSTSFQYDESDVPYFYETRSFPIHPPTREQLQKEAEEAERIRTRPLGAYIRTRYLALCMEKSEEDCRITMERDGYCKEVIDEFFKSRKSFVE